MPSDSMRIRACSTIACSQASRGSVGTSTVATRMPGQIPCSSVFESVASRLSLIVFRDRWPSRSSSSARTGFVSFSNACDMFDLLSARQRTEQEDQVRSSLPIADKWLNDDSARQRSAGPRVGFCLAHSFDHGLEVTQRAGSGGWQTRVRSRLHNLQNLRNLNQFNHFFAS